MVHMHNCAQVVAPLLDMCSLLLTCYAPSKDITLSSCLFATSVQRILCIANALLPVCCLWVWFVVGGHTAGKASNILLA